MSDRSEPLLMALCPGLELSRCTCYILRRLLIAIPTSIGMTVLIFIAMRVLPG